jgi:hypothetical protein
MDAEVNVAGVIENANFGFFRGRSSLEWLALAKIIDGKRDLPNRIIKRPSRRGACSARAATAAPASELAASVCARTSAFSADIRIASDAKLQCRALLILPDRRTGLILVMTEYVEHLFRHSMLLAG